MCRAYAEFGLLFLMYLICSWCLVLRFLLVCPTYAFWHVLQFIVYMPLLSYSGVVCGVFGLRNFSVVVAGLKAMLIFVFLNRFVIALILGLWYVKIAHLLLSASGFGLGFWFFSLWLSLWSICWYVIVFPLVFMVSHSLCLLSLSSGRVCILFMWCRYTAILCSVG